ncbi:MAG: hypothetical protein ACP5FP_09850 [Desulfuromonadaceae bacterium]|jgi:hypothetical protein
MHTLVILKSLCIWGVILVLAIFNGALREKFLFPAFGVGLGLFLSGIILAAMILLLTWLTLPWLGVMHRAGFLYVGILWLILTLIFEFSFGMFLQGKSWQELLQAYTFSNGNIWPLVLLVTGAAPCVGAKIRGLI